METMLPLLLSVASGKWPHPSGTHNSQLPTHNIVNWKLDTVNLVRLCFHNPNRIFNLGKKGIIEDARADLILVDPHAEWTVAAKDLHSKCGWTPYEGWKMTGKAVRVIHG